MYDEIDLRPYFQVIAKKWLWIVLMSIVLGFVGLVFGLTRPDVYKAKTLLAVNKATPNVSLDGRIQDASNDWDTSLIFPELAKSDELLQAFIAQAEFLPDGWEIVEQLNAHIEVETRAANSLIVLTVSAEDPQDAMRIANTYGAFSADWLNQIYGDDNIAQNAFFLEQFDAATEQLNDIVARRQEFDGEYGLTAVRNYLDSVSQAHREHITTTKQLDLLLLDLQAFQGQIEGGVSARPLNTIEETTLLALQLRTYQAETFPVTVNVSTNTIDSEITVSEARTLLNRLIETVNERILYFNAKILEFEQQLLTLQRQNRQLTAQETQLQTDYEVALEFYKALSYRLDEQILTEQEVEDSVFILSRASLPTQAIGFGALIYLLVGLLFGGFLGASGLIIYTWWQVQVSA